MDRRSRFRVGCAARGPTGPRADRMQPAFSFGVPLLKGWAATRRGGFARIERLAGFRYFVCLENSYEPYLFTEKFVNAVRAMCVPIYHAHPTIRDTILKSAMWIDPADYGYDVSATFAAARKTDVASIQENNLRWLKSDALKASDGFAIWTRIAEYFEARFQQSTESLSARTLNALNNS